MKKPNDWICRLVDWFLCDGNILLILEYFFWMWHTVLSLKYDLSELKSICFYAHVLKVQIKWFWKVVSANKYSFLRFALISLNIDNMGIAYCDPSSRKLSEIYFSAAKLIRLATVFLVKTFVCLILHLWRWFLLVKLLFEKNPM